MAGTAARYATAAAAFERAGRLTAGDERRARLLREAAEAGWLAGFTDRAVALLGEARAAASDPGDAGRDRRAGWPHRDTAAAR